MIHHASFPPKRGPITPTAQCQGGNRPRARTQRPGVRVVPAFAETTQPYFLVLVSAGFAASGLAASGLASGLAAVSSGLSMRSTLAASRSLVT
jgi:hypothetical protein